MSKIGSTFYLLNRNGLNMIVVSSRLLHSILFFSSDHPRLSYLIVTDWFNFREHVKHGISSHSQSWLILTMHIFSYIGQNNASVSWHQWQWCRGVRYIVLDRIWFMRFTSPCNYVMISARSSSMEIPGSRRPPYFAFHSSPRSEKSPKAKHSLSLRDDGKKRA